MTAKISWTSVGENASVGWIDVMKVDRVGALDRAYGDQVKKWPRWPIKPMGYDLRASVQWQCNAGPSEEFQVTGWTDGGIKRRRCIGPAIIQRACRGTEEEVIKTGWTDDASIQGIGAMTSSKTGMSEGVQRLSGACAGWSVEPTLPCIGVDSTNT